MKLKKIAIIGQPNVGKSSLYNRLVKRREAIVSEVTGTTRDIKNKEVELLGKKAILLDTGGLDESTEMFQTIHRLSLKTAKEADIILYMVDGRVYPEESDKEIFYELQKLKGHLMLVVNKVDNEKIQNDAWSFYEFGVDDISFISVSHNSGVNALIAKVAELLPALPEEEVVEASEEEEEIDEEALLLAESEKLHKKFSDEDEGALEKTEDIRVAIIGRVNVGKSSLLNSLLQEERSVVSPIAGTTIDPVNEYRTHKDKVINFVDTAGLRKRGKIEGLERYALMRTESMLEHADVALLVLDTSEPFKELDERIANLADKFSLGVILVLNKWDNRQDIEYDEYIDEVRDRFKFLAYAPIITVSALTNQRVSKIYDMILSVYANYTKRISTSEFNKLLEYAMMIHQLPSDKGRDTRIYYGTQYKTMPPKFAVVMNRPSSLHFSYKRYLTNKLREKFGFEGTPIYISARKKGQRSDLNYDKE